MPAIESKHVPLFVVILSYLEILQMLPLGPQWNVSQPLRPPEQNWTWLSLVSNPTAILGILQTPSLSQLKLHAVHQHEVWLNINDSVTIFSISSYKWWEHPWASEFKHRNLKKYSHFSKYKKYSCDLLFRTELFCSSRYGPWHFLSYYFWPD